MTPDGISTEDWDRVHALAVEVVNASSAGNMPAGAAAQQALLAWLDELLRRYGPLPSILATRADYVDGVAERERLLLAAYEEAERRADARNLAWVSSSLAGLYVEDQHNHAEGERWLERLRQHAAAVPDTSETDEYNRLRSILSDGVRGRRTRVSGLLRQDRKY